ncbi:Uncharacterised protein [Sphingobacterium mizutaii]|uniref:Uncharacterized protein n=2 Tax=Sphingobacterium mizutaii TaxID=1010 RepID=A0AAJ4XB38_9SPHI|nr:hypothetical protein [Sphingobacterium mizutaii]SDK97173.1 hypothetical protein SAMN05192578_101595 [Sphingobacterium mizutaii]SNV49176.1 Uncharacterised protein [Sphingobacterium mizutaii]
MKKLMYLLMLLLLGLSSCKKDETFNEMETFVINGETFSVSETRMRLAVILDIDENRLTYIPEKVAFKLDTRNDQDLIYIEPIIESIKNVKLPKSQSYR